MSILVHCAWDGDSIGAKVGRASLADDANQLRQLDHAIKSGNEIFTSWAVGAGGSVVEDGGDEGRVVVPADRLADLPDLRERYHKAVGATVSVGVGAKLSEAGKALLAAKIAGKDRIRLYDQSVEEVLANVQPQSEEEKIRDAYLLKSMKSAAFKDPTGRVWETGNYHEIMDLPEEVRQLDLEPGFIDQQGNFLDRSQAAQSVGVQGELQSQDPQTFGKAEPKEPQAETEGNQVGRHMQQAPDAPIAPDGTPAEEPVPEDLHGGFQQLASAQSGQDQAQGAQQQQEAQAGDAKATLKDQVMSVLKVFKARQQELEEIGKQDPELYKALLTAVQSMSDMAREVLQAPDPVQKSEPNLPKIAKLCKECNKTHLGKCELQKEGLDPGKTGRHNVVLPVGSQIDSGPQSNRDGGKIKVQDMDTGKTKWRQVRANMVMDPQGNPTSSRNPSGGVKPQQ